MIFDYKKQSDEFWKKHLQPEIYNICRARGTERAGTGQYDKLYEAGTYYCACCGGDYALFSSITKFDSGTGWPSFWDPISSEAVTLREDNSGFGGLLSSRTEVLCSRCDSHLGHVFDDGPTEHTGKRYCMNSLALVFAPKDKKPVRTFEID